MQNTKKLISWKRVFWDGPFCARNPGCICVWQLCVCVSACMSTCVCVSLCLSVCVQRLLSTKHSRPEQFVSANLPSNEHKNRHANVLPCELNCVVSWFNLKRFIVSYCCLAKIFTARTELRKILFLALRVTFYLFVCLCMKYLWNRWTHFHQIHRDDVFHPSLGQVWMSRSKVKGQGHHR